MLRLSPFFFLICLAGTVAVIAEAATRKAGLWELTTTMTWQRSPSTPGTAAPGLTGGTRTTQVCLTQEMIDKYGALLPQSRGQCTIANKVISPGSVTGDWVCNGIMSGKGALESRWSDAEHARSKVHFVGTFQMGSTMEPVEWTTESTAIFKSEQCGAVQPQGPPKTRH
jgi:hypothetical protein